MPYQMFPFEPPPAYSTREPPHAPPATSQPHETPEELRMDEVYGALVETLNAFTLFKLRYPFCDVNGTSFEEDQLLDEMIKFLTSLVEANRPRKRGGLSEPPTGVPHFQASLYLAAIDVVPSCWHLSGTTAKDNEILGLYVSEGRIRTRAVEHKDQVIKTGTPAAKTMDLSIATAANLGAALHGLSLNEVVDNEKEEPWWINERDAQRATKHLVWIMWNLMPRGWQSQWVTKTTNQGFHNRASGVNWDMFPEQMTFRRLNEMGLWESRSALTIVLRVSGKRYIPPSRPTS